MRFPRLQAKLDPCTGSFSYSLGRRVLVRAAHRKLFAKLAKGLHATACHCLHCTHHGPCPAPGIVCCSAALASAGVDAAGPNFCVPHGLQLAEPLYGKLWLAGEEHWQCSTSYLQPAAVPITERSAEMTEEEA